jgi:exosome complex component RRP40
MRFFCPGETLPLPADAKTSLGICERGEEKVSMQAGELREMEGKRFWIDAPMKRYAPLLDDLVIGQVHSKGREFYRIDIGAPYLAVMSVLDFPNATKRSKPSLQPGDIVFAQVAEERKCTDIRITAVSQDRDMCGLGHLSSGVVVSLGILKCRALLLGRAVEELGEKRTFSIAVGANGLVWVDSPEDTHKIIRDLRKIPG